MRERNENREHGVYRYLTKDNQYLYVGKTDRSIRSRIVAHKIEPKFQNLPEYKVEYVILSNAVESDCIEKFLINKYKPILNDKDKVDGLTAEINIENLKWRPYETYEFKKHESFSRNVTMAKQQYQYLQAIMNCDEDGYFHFTQMSNLLLPIKDEYFILSDKNSYFDGKGYVFRINEDELLLVKENYYRIIADIFTPILNRVEMDEDDELVYSIASSAMEFGEVIDHFADNGFIDDRSYEQYIMSFDNTEQEILECYGDIFAEQPWISKNMNFVEIPSDLYFQYIDICKEKAAKMVLPLLEKLELVPNKNFEYEFL